MKIKLAKRSGFCMGVRNAVLKIVDEINRADGEILVYGSLIHNPQTIAALEKRGLKTIKSLDNIKDQQVVIRTHGIPKEEYDLIRQKALRAINLTCPRVARVQGLIKKYSRKGYFTLIIGDRDHAEVIGLQSYAESGYHVVQEEEDINDIPVSNQYLVISQTTIERDFFNRMVDIIGTRFPKVEVIDTICDSTRNRQDDVLCGIKENITKLIVVGGLNSANTNRLAKIGRDHGIPTFHVETDEDLSPDDFNDTDTVLVTAGASTPGWIINNVLERMFTIKFKKSNIIINTVKQVLEFIVRTNIFAAAASFFMTHMAQHYAGFNPELPLSAIAFLYIFSMISVNNYLDREFLKASHSYKFAIYERYGVFLFFLSIVSMIISLVIALQYGFLPLVILLVSYSIGLIYSTSLLRILLKRLNLPALRNVYYSKIATDLGWLVAIVLLPILHFMDNTLLFTAIAFYFFIIIVLRHILLDMIALQGDLILGRVTLPIWFGIKQTGWAATLFAGSILVFYMLVTAYSNPAYLLLSVNILYYIFLIMYTMRKKYLISLKYELLVDFNYVIMIALFLGIFFS